MTLGQASDDVIDHVGLVQVEGLVEGLAKVLGLYVGPVLLVVLQDGGQQRGCESEGGGGDGVGRAGVGVDVVAGEEAHRERTQVVLVHGLLSQDDGQVLVVGDVLDLGADDSSRFLKVKIYV